jgi:hypothetical protein
MSISFLIIALKWGEYAASSGGNVGDFRDASKPKNRRVVGRDGLSERAVFGVEASKKRVRKWEAASRLPLKIGETRRALLR